MRLPASFVSTALVASVGIMSSAAMAESIKFERAHTIDYATGGIDVNIPNWTPATAGATAVYDAPVSVAGGFSSTNLTNIWGDEIILAGTGQIPEIRFSLYNSSSSAGTLTSATVTLGFFAPADTSLTTPLGLLSANLNYGSTPLGVGFYSTWTITGISGVNLTGYTDVLMVQQLSNVVGTTTRLGVVGGAGTTVGTGTNAYYGLTAGAYTSTTTNPNFLYSVAAVVPEPASLSTLGLAGIVLIRRRKA